MADKVFNIIIKLLKQGGADAETVKGLVDVTKSLAQVGIVAGAMTGAIAAVDKVIKSTIGEFVKYATEVDIFSSALGTSAEQASRLIQVADDFGISAQTMQSDLFKAVQGGMVPTIDGLANMADQYNALKSPTEQAIFLTKNFGKSSQELSRLLGEGGQAIRDRAAAVAAGLLVDEAAIEKAQELATVQDDLNDKGKAISLTIGEALIPAQIGLTELMLKSITLTDQQSRALVYFNRALNTGKISQDRYIEDLQRMGIDLSFGIVKTDEMAKATETAAEAVADLGLTTKQATIYTDAYNATLTKTGSAAEASAAAQKALAAEIEAEQKALAAAIATEFSAVSDYAQNYTKSQEDIKKANEDVAAAEAAVATARKQGWAETGEHMTDLKTKLQDAKTAVEDLQAAQQRQTDQWVLNVLTQQLSMDGLTSAEMTFLLKYQQDTGLITAEAAKRAQAQYDYALALAAGVNVTVPVNVTPEVSLDATTLPEDVRRRVSEQMHMPSAANVGQGAEMTVPVTVKPEITIDSAAAIAEDNKLRESRKTLVSEIQTGNDTASLSDTTFLTNYQAMTGLFVPSVASRQAGVQNLVDTINKLEDKTVTITTIHEDIYRSKGGHARGADFIVPPGFPDDSFIMNVESGERVIVIPKEQSYSGKLPGVTPVSTGERSTIVQAGADMPAGQASGDSQAVREEIRALRSDFKNLLTLLPKTIADAVERRV